MKFATLILILFMLPLSRGVLYERDTIKPDVVGMERWRRMVEGAKNIWRSQHNIGSQAFLANLEAALELHWEVLPQTTTSAPATTTSTTPLPPITTTRKHRHSKQQHLNVTLMAAPMNYSCGNDTTLEVLDHFVNCEEMLKSGVLGVQLESVFGCQLCQSLVRIAATAVETTGHVAKSNLEGYCNMLLLPFLTELCKGIVQQVPNILNSLEEGITVRRICELDLQACKPVRLESSAPSELCHACRLSAYSRDLATLHPANLMKRQSRFQFVDPDTILTPEEVLLEHLNTDIIFNIFHPNGGDEEDKTAATEFLVRHGLLRNTVTCIEPCTPGPATLVHDTSRPENYFWKCKGPNCDKKKRSPREGAFFAHMRMSYYRSLKILYIWSTNPTMSECSGACQGAMVLHKYTSTDDRFRWACKNCRNVFKSVRSDSFFEDSNLEIRQTLQLLHVWSNRPETHMNQISTDIGVNKNTVVKFFNKFREICEDWCRENLMNAAAGIQIGGPGTIVEIDESLFYKQKYHVGQVQRQQWVFGMIERGSNNVIMIPVPRRDAATLLPLIDQHIAAGTRIISDGWAAYGGIAQIQIQFQGFLQNKYAQHDVINHSQNFVDPADPAIHTQSMEGTWHAAKESMRQHWGTSEEMLERHLFQYMFRRAHNKEKIFENMLFWIRHYYPV